MYEAAEKMKSFIYENFLVKQREEIYFEIYSRFSNFSNCIH